MNDEERARRYAELDEAVITEAAERVHAALLAAQGTANAPTIEKVAQYLRETLDLHDHEDGRDYEFLWSTGGFVVHFEANRGPGPGVFRILVPATGSLIRWAEPKEKK